MTTVATEQDDLAHIPRITLPEGKNVSRVEYEAWAKGGWMFWPAPANGFAGRRLEVGNS